MKIYTMPQGSPEWDDLRRAHPRSASKAPAMMGAAPITTRAELLTQFVTGVEKEYSQWVKDNLFAKGHEIEAAARPLAEAIVGEALYPVTGVSDDGYLLASYDGLSMDELSACEIKSWNEKKAADVRAGRIPEEDKWQVIQQLAVGADRVMYMVTDGTAERCEYLWKYRDAGECARLVQGWREFDKDLATHQAPEAAPAAVADPIESIGSLVVIVEGKVVSTNLDSFRERSLAFVRSINTDLQTDQDFTNAKAAVKFCKDAETKLEQVKAQATDQMETVGAVFRTIDLVKEELKAVRLRLDGLVKARNEALRLEIVQEAKCALESHIVGLHSTHDLPSLPGVAMASADFAASIKGKSSFAKMRQACEAELILAKLDASEAAGLIVANRASMTGLEHLFPDFSAVCLKAADDFSSLVAARVAAEERRKAAETARIEAEKEAAVKAAIAVTERRERMRAENERLRLEQEAETERRQIDKKRRETEEAERHAAHVREQAERRTASEREQADALQASDAEAQRGREADQEHRQSVHREAMLALLPYVTRMTEARAVLEAIIRGEIPGVTIKY